MLESAFQSHLVRRLKVMFPGCFVIKQDANSRQGIPDLLILFNDRWAMLEVKQKATSREQPNQRYYVEMFDDMSFAAFIFPENEEDVLNGLQHAFTARRPTRFPKR